MATLTNAVTHGVHDEVCFANQTQLISITPHILAVAMMAMEQQRDMFWMRELKEILTGGATDEEKFKQKMHALDELDKAIKDMGEVVDLILTNNVEAMRAEQEFHDHDLHDGF
jgi:predicted peroxiredoxin